MLSTKKYATITKRHTPFSHPSQIYRRLRGSVSSLTSTAQLLEPDCFWLILIRYKKSFHEIHVLRGSTLRTTFTSATDLRLKSNSTFSSEYILDVLYCDHIQDRIQIGFGIAKSFPIKHGDHCFLPCGLAHGTLTLEPKFSIMFSSLVFKTD